MKQRIAYIDAVKGFAIFSVILNHCNNMLYWENTVLGNIIASYYMSVFFFISGYFSYKSNLDIPTFVKKKTKELLGPLLTICLVINVFKCWYYGQNFIETALLSTMKGGYWFLYVLYAFYGLYVLISYTCHYLKKYGINETTCFIGLSVSIYLIIFVVTYYATDTIMYSFFSLPNFRRYFPLFVLGLLIRMYEPTFSVWTNNKTIVCGMVYFIVLILYLHVPEKSFINLGLWSVCTIFGCIFIINFFRIFYVERLSYWGKYTLSIYIYHYICLYIVRGITPPNIFLCINENQLLALFAYSLISIIIIEVCIYIVSHIKHHWWNYIFGV